VDSKEVYSFSTKMQKVIAGFAEQMAWHLHREKQGLIRPKEEIFPYQEMLDYNRTLTGLADSAAVAEQLLNIPPSIFSCDAMALVWFDREDGLGRVARHRGWGMNLTDLQITPGKGIIGSCAKNKVPIWVENSEERKAVMFAEKEDLDEFKARLVVPILSNNELLGIVACASKQPAGLTHSHLNRLALIASYVASTLASLKIKQKWEYAKNLDTVTGIPNHRFLADYRRSIETEILNQHKSVFALVIHLKNLTGLYETFGVEMGDSLLRQVVSILSNSLPAPKHVFKYSDAAFLALLMQVKREEAYHLENRLKMVFEENPVYINGKPMAIVAELGLSSFPEDGKNLAEIIGVAWSRTSHHAKVTS
jgi:diguanylate cyclase (GGDEF)-like protein